MLHGRVVTTPYGSLHAVLRGVNSPGKGSRYLLPHPMWSFSPKSMIIPLPGDRVSRKSHLVGGGGNHLPLKINVKSVN